MSKKLMRYGENLAIIIDQPILKSLNINEKTKLQIKTDGNKIIIEPVVEKLKKEPKKIKLKNAYKKIIEKHGEDFEKLAKN